METALNHSHSKTSSSSGSLLLSIPIYVYVGVVCSMAVILGIIWDIAWHMSIGRDGLFSPPHVVVYIGAATAGIFSGYQVLKTSFWGNDFEKSRMVHFWGVFYSSLGGLFCIWGGLAAITSAPFDDWWHNTYGLDVQIFSPPHTVLLMGLMSVQLGAMTSVLSILNRKDYISTLTAEQNQKRETRLKWMFILTAGFLLTTLYTFMFEFLGRWNMHTGLFYQIGSSVLILALVSAPRASRMKWGTTYIAITYMIFFWLINATLRLFPAEPLLGPINNPITTYQTMGFPLVLVVPALVLDIVRNRFAHLNDWLLSVVLATAYLVVFFVFNYYWGYFIHESVYARNWFFGSHNWSFDNDPTWDGLYKFGEWSTKGLANWAKELGIALALGIISTRIALLWGKWMQKVVR
ncbi:MAG: hypothetical protein ACK4NY_01430 [Spirosomataceae bacterium]